MKKRDQGTEVHFSFLSGLNIGRRTEKDCARSLYALIEGAMKADRMVEEAREKCLRQRWTQSFLWRD